MTCFCGVLALNLRRLALEVEKGPMGVDSEFDDDKGGFDDEGGFDDDGGWT